MALEQQQVEPTAAEQTAIEELPVLAVRDTVLFPGAMLPITVGRPASVALVNSLGESRTIAIVSQLDPRVDSPKPEDLYQIGTVCVMHKAIRVPKENLLLFCEGVSRIRTVEFTATEPFLRAKIERIAEPELPDTPELEALRQNVAGLFRQIVAASPNLSDDLAATASQINESGRLADWVAGNLPSLSPAERQALLEMQDGAARLAEIHRNLTRELELLELRGRIQSQVQGQLSQSQREFYLREQLKAIQKELGEGDESPLPEGTLPFSDTAGHWAAAAGYLQAGVGAHALDGYPDGTFRPDGPVTRAELVKIVAAAAGVPAAVDPTTYTDVPAEAWYAAWISRATAAGLIGPGALFAGDHFLPDQPATRAEAAMLLYKAGRH
jgi:Lon protease-like protein